MNSPRLLAKNCVIALFLLLAVYQPPAFAADAEVIYATGETYAVDSRKQRRNLKSQSAVNQGDTVIVETGYLQLRFSDGGLISFYDNTEFKIEDYQYSENRQGEGKAFFQFIKGMYRTMLGAIKNKRYQVKTNMAAIGTRGTEYRAILNEKHLKIDVFEGVVLLKNETGDFEVPAGHSILITDSVTPPVLLEMDSRAYRNIHQAPDSEGSRESEPEHDDVEEKEIEREELEAPETEREERENFESDAREIEDFEREGEEPHTEFDEYERDTEEPDEEEEEAEEPEEEEPEEDEEEPEEEEEDEEELAPAIDPRSITIENILNGKIPLERLRP